MHMYTKWSHFRRKSNVVLLLNYLYKCDHFVKVCIKGLTGTDFSVPSVITLSNWKFPQLERISISPCVCSSYREEVYCMITSTSFDRKRKKKENTKQSLLTTIVILCRLSNNHILHFAFPLSRGMALINIHSLCFVSIGNRKWSNS